MAGGVRCARCVRREKELMKAQERQERALTRVRQHAVVAGPPDDEDVEWEALLEVRPSHAAPPSTPHCFPAAFLTQALHTARVRPV